MAITLKYRVASARTEPCTVDATLDGKTVTATVERLVLDLVSEDGAHGYKQPLPAVDTAGLAAQVEAFNVGTEVAVTIDAATLAGARNIDDSPVERDADGMIRGTPLNLTDEQRAKLPPLAEGNEGRLMEHPGTGEAMTEVQPNPDGTLTL